MTQAMRNAAGMAIVKHGAGGKTTSARRLRQDRQAESARTARKARRTAATPEERHQLIAIAAYYRAERRSFAPGCELEDWLASEAEVDAGQQKG